MIVTMFSLQRLLEAPNLLCGATCHFFHTPPSLEHCSHCCSLKFESTTSLNQQLPPGLKPRDGNAKDLFYWTVAKTNKAKYEFRSRLCAHRLPDESQTIMRHSQQCCGVITHAYVHGRGAREGNKSHIGSSF